MKPNNLAAEWILGRVIYYYSDIGAYDVVDIDDSKVLKLPETQIIALDAANVELQKKLLKNDEVYAVYPDTSTFYPCIVNQVPKKASASAGTVEATVQVQFNGDETEGKEN